VVTHDKLGDIGKSPGKSSLFFLTIKNDPGIRLTGDRVNTIGKALYFLKCPVRF